LAEQLGGPAAQEEIGGIGEDRDEDFFGAREIRGGFKGGVARVAFLLAIGASLASGARLASV